MEGGRQSGILIWAAEAVERLPGNLSSGNSGYEVELFIPRGVFNHGVFEKKCNQDGQAGCQYH